MAHCPRHPGSLATDLCVECGECVCGQCAWVTPDRRVFCPACRARARLGPPAPEPGQGQGQAPRTLPAARSRPGPRPRAAAQQQWSPTAITGPKAAAKNSKAVIGSLILPFVCCIYGAVVGLILAIRERKLIQEGRSTSSPGLVAASLWINGLVLAATVLFFLLVPDR